MPFAIVRNATQQDEIFRGSMHRRELADQTATTAWLSAGIGEIQAVRAFIYLKATTGSPTSVDFQLQVADDASGTGATTVARSTGVLHPAGVVIRGMTPLGNKTHFRIVQTITGGTSPTATWDAVVDVV